MELIDLYEQMYLIRSFETRLESLFKEGVLFGTIHCCIGQEASAVGIINAISPEDIVTGHHRSHGHYLAYAGDVEGLMAEIMGKGEGVVAGRGGSQHIHRGNFYSNGVQGSMVPVATGMAFAEKLRNSGRIAVCFIGDGTLGQGVLYESMNMAALYKLPVLYIVENNQYAMSTSVKDGVAGSILDRGRAFGIRASEVRSNDVEEIYRDASEVVKMVRQSGAPYFYVVHTYRLCGHSKSDDRAYRTKEEELEWSKSDPILMAEKKLRESEVAEVRRRCENRIAATLDKVRAMPSASGIDVDAERRAQRGGAESIRHNSGPET